MGQGQAECDRPNPDRATSKEHANDSPDWFCRFEANYTLNADLPRASELSHHQR